MAAGNPAAIFIFSKETRIELSPIKSRSLHFAESPKDGDSPPVGMTN